MKILVFSANTKSLIHFRMDMMDYFASLGHSVYAIGDENSSEIMDLFLNKKIKYYAINVSRNGINFLKDIEYKKEIAKIIDQIKPDKVFIYQAKPIVYGIPILKKSRISEIYPMMGGLGSIFRGNGIKNRIFKAYLKLKYEKSFALIKDIIFQNNDDINLFKKMRIIKNQKVHMINGSGVNVEQFSFLEMPSNPCFLFVGRLLKDKGIEEYLNACEIIRKKYPNTRCILVGPFDDN